MQARTRTGKDVFKDRVEPGRLAVAFHDHACPGWLAPGAAVAHLDEAGLTQDFISVAAADSHFSRLPRVWSLAAPEQRLQGEPCAPIGVLPPETLALFAQEERIGLNFRAKGAFWPDPLVQIPEKTLRFAPAVMPILAFLKENLPDARLWPAVDVVFKISAGRVRKSGTGLDPFLVRKQATGWHTDGDSVSEARAMKAGLPPVRDRTPPSNAHALVKQRLIVSSAVPTAFSSGWEFTDDRGPGIVTSNGYPPRKIADPVLFPPGTVVAFTNNNMHTATYAEADTHRTVMIVSGTISWGHLRRLAQGFPDIPDSLSPDAPASLRLPALWNEAYSAEQSRAAAGAFTRDRPHLIP